MFQRFLDFQYEKAESLVLLVHIWTRFILAFASLLVFFVDPVEAGFPSRIAHILLITYCLYSLCLIFIYDMRAFRDFTSNRAFHWADILIFSILIALTGGSDSIFFFFFFSPILVASFSWGYKEGIKVTIATAFLFSIVGWASALAPHAIYDIGEAILRPIYLFVFGYTMASWGEGRIILKQRVRLLNNISTLWNPRFGVDHVIMTSIDKLLEFYNGSRCMIVMNRTGPISKHILYESNRNKSYNSEKPKELAEKTAAELLSIPNNLAVGYKCKSGPRYFNNQKYFAYDVNTAEPTDQYVAECSSLSNLLDNESFISVPYQQQGVPTGRLYLIPGKITFSRADISFIKQVANGMASVLDKVELVETLIEEAEGQERHRISLDVHDTTIQPYIALTLALDALNRRFKLEDQLGSAIREIIDMANMTIIDLRSFKDTLREKSLMRGDVLLSAINHQAERMLRFYGIKFVVSGMVTPNLPGKIAEAAFHIIKEALSNVLRHTNAKAGFVMIKCDDFHLHIDIGNEPNVLSQSPSGEPSNTKLFKPKSILERVGTLGGNTIVEFDTNRYTVVRITIPLPEK